MAPSSRRDEPTSSATPMAAALDAKLMVATTQGDCQKLKEVLNDKKDSTAMVVVMALGHGNNAAPVAPTDQVINPMLLASACSCDPMGLHLLLNGEAALTAGDGRHPHSIIETQRFRDLLAAYTSSKSKSLVAQQHVPADLDDPEALHNHLPAPSAEALLQGLTVDGDTALHALATHGDDDNDGNDFLQCAHIICSKARHLLFKQNKKGDTPVHCAARAGKSRIVSRLIDLARGNDKDDSSMNIFVKKLLETENELKETVLHEAVRNGDNDMVELLMEEDPELASYPEDGTSALFLAIMLEEDTIVETLYSKSNQKLSYSGQNGQNALHAAVLRGEDLTKKLLEWNENLTTERDENGSTPLHFAAAVQTELEWSTLAAMVRTKLGWIKHTAAITCTKLGWIKPTAAMAQTKLGWINSTVAMAQTKLGWIKPSAAMALPHAQETVCWHILEANPAALYHADKDGLFPIHVAASVGAIESISIFLRRSPSCAGLRDGAKGRTFLHVAVEKGRACVVSYACRKQLLSWILNMQDSDGNTALHLAVQAGNLQLFSTLFGNQHVRLNLSNNKEQSPLDIAQYKIPRRMRYNQNSEHKIHNSLVMAKARSGSCRKDHFKEWYAQQRQHDERVESELVKDSTQTLVIGSVLIATVTFGATFALPGGYRADDRTNGGTPTLAGRYAFDTFIMADTFAFIFAAIATIGLMNSGSPLCNSKSRKVYLSAAFYCIQISITCLSATFAVGVYMVLAPVAPKTAIAICVLSPLVVLFKDLEFWINQATRAPWVINPEPIGYVDFDMKGRFHEHFANVEEAERKEETKLKTVMAHVAELIVESLCYNL
ncbi:hypothetical protein ABZP36_035296 [Zizania latifolia]